MKFPSATQFTEKLLENLYDGVYYVSRGRRILYWNKGAERISGYSADEVLGSYCYANILDHIDEKGCHFCRRGCPLAKAIRKGETLSARVELRHKEGRRVPVDVCVMPVHDDDGKIVGGVEVFRDATPQVALETAFTEMQHLAERDPLTGIANRRHLEMMLEMRVEMLRKTGIPCSIIMADLDHFKEVNDTWGHSVGDQALIGFAGMLKDTCRNTDVVGRLGGEEFLVILPESPLANAVAIAERMRASTPRVAPAELGERQLTASFGVVLAELGDTVEHLSARVDAALYRAKQKGRNRVES